MLLLAVGIGQVIAMLLACQRYGAQRLLPLMVLLSLGSAVMFNLGLALTPLMGLIAGYQTERQQGYGQTIAAAAIPGVVQALWLLLASDALPREELVEQFLGQLKDMGMQLSADMPTQRRLVAAVLRLQPGIEFVSTLFILVLAYHLSQRVAGLVRVSLPAALPFRLWRPWPQLIWVLIAGLALKLLGSGLAEDLALNLMMVMAILYAVQGLALVRFYCWRWGIPRLVEPLLYLALVFTSGVSVILLAGLGLLDTWFDWRRLESSAAPSPPEEGDTE